jgi:hypothetical protein
MSTSMIHFTQDPDEDITNAPQYYHNFGSAAVRIKTYWTTPIWTNPALLAHSLRLIKTADSILRKYTLKLDAVPWGNSPALRAPLRRAFDKKHPAAGLHLRPILGHTLPSPMTPRLRSLVQDPDGDNLADTADGRLNYNYSISVPREGDPSIEAVKPIRKLIEPVVEENRLIVVFIPIEGGADGIAAIFPDWLPWILVDPKDYSGDTYLLHEIGHACRLAHQQFATPAPPTQEASSHYRNVMSYIPPSDRFWGWQVDAIYDSYWCTGSRPKNWWDRTNARLPMDHPFLWDEPP